MNNLSNFYMVAYYDRMTGELARIESYPKIDGEITGCQSAIDSYRYGYDAKIFNPEDVIPEEYIAQEETNELAQIRKTNF